MSQTYTVIDTGASGDTAASAWGKQNNNNAALVTLHSGTSAPSTTYAYMLWMDTTNGILKIRNGGDSGWQNLFPVVAAAGATTPAGGGLATLTAAAFTTAAPTSAVAASTSSGLTRKGEVDAREQVVSFAMGTVSATTGVYLWVGGPAITVVDVSLAVNGTTTSDGSNNWSFQIEQTADSVNLLSTAKTTNGAEITAETTYDLEPDQNLTVTADEPLLLTATKTGSATALEDLTISLRYTIAT